MRTLIIYFTTLLLALALFSCADPLRNKDVYVQTVEPPYVITYLHYKGEKDSYLVVDDRDKSVRMVFVDLKSDNTADYAQLMRPLGDGRYEVVKKVYRKGNDHDWELADQYLVLGREYSEKVYGGR